MEHAHSRRKEEISHDSVHANAVCGSEDVERRLVSQTIALTILAVLMLVVLVLAAYSTHKVRHLKNVVLGLHTKLGGTGPASK